MEITERNKKLSDEKSFLNNIYKEYRLNDDPQTRVMREFAFKTIEPYLTKDHVGLELGCSDGYLTEILASRIKHLDVVDGSLSFVEGARKRGIKNAAYHHSLFEEFDANVKYDCIFATYIFEHVLEPQMVLEVVHRLLKPDGIFYIVVPNARALSRQLAMHMGLYTDLEQYLQNLHY